MKKRIVIPIGYVFIVIFIIISFFFIFVLTKQQIHQTIAQNKKTSPVVEMLEPTSEKTTYAKLSPKQEPIIVYLDSPAEHVPGEIVDIDALSKPIETSITISAVGDCTIGSDSNFGYTGSFYDYYDRNTPDYFFEGVLPVLGSDDYTIANLEGTFTSYNTPTNKQFRFKAPEKYADILKLGSIEGVNIANNHTRDYGETGYKDTIATLEEKNIDYYGNDNIIVKEIKGIKIGIAGFNEYANTFDEKNTWNNIKSEIQKKLSKLEQMGADIKILSFHWGQEGSYIPNETQTKIAHFSIDAGADLVLGHHPHVLQKVEMYKDKTIVYSLGNFCFGGNKNPPDKDSMIFQTTYTFSDGNFNKADYKIIPVSISSEKNKNNFKPTILKGADKKRVLKKVSANM